MRSILVLCGKDLRLLIRDRFGLFWVLAFPLLMAFFFGAIFSSEGADTARLDIAAVDRGGTESGTALLQELARSNALRVRRMSLDSASALVGTGRLAAYVAVGTPGDSARASGPWTPPAIEIGMDPARRVEAGYLEGLVSQAYYTRLQSLMTDPAASRRLSQTALAQIDTAQGMPAKERQALKDLLIAWQNYGEMADSGNRAKSSPYTSLNIRKTPVTVGAKYPHSSFEITFPQALLWGLLGVTLAFAHSIVAERTGGTYNRLRVAPINRAQILAGKALASFCTSVGVCAVLLIIGRIFCGIRIANAPGLVAAVIACALCFSGLVMLISVLGKTERSVAGAGWGIMLLMSMIGGGMIPLMVMPSWMLTLSHFSPVKWGILSLEGAIWRGFSLTDMMLPVGILLGAGAIAFSIGVTIFARADE